MDIMKIRKCFVLHIVDRETIFSAAIFLNGESSAYTWEALLAFRVAVYLGYPEEVILDQGPQLQNGEFQSFLTASGITTLAQRAIYQFQNHSALNLQTFDLKRRVYNNFFFFGTQVFSIKQGTFAFQQADYIRTLD